MKQGCRASMMHLLVPAAQVATISLSCIHCAFLSVHRTYVALRSGCRYSAAQLKLHHQAWRKEQRPPARAPERSARRQMKRCPQLRRRPLLRSPRRPRRRQSCSGRFAGVWRLPSARRCSPSSMRHMARCAGRKPCFAQSMLQPHSVDGQHPNIADANAGAPKRADCWRGVPVWRWRLRPAGDGRGGDGTAAALPAEH